MFRDAGIHDYEAQSQGPANKVVRPAFMLAGGDIMDVPVSLYRPVTKKGDPRLWFYEFKKFCRSK